MGTENLKDETIIVSAITFTVTAVNGQKTYIYGSDIKDIFGKIDGLRLEGKRWLETFDFFEDTTHKIYVNIDHIVSIE